MPTVFEPDSKSLVIMDAELNQRRNDLIERVQITFRRVSELARIIDEEGHATNLLRLEVWTEPDGLAKVINTLLASSSPFY